MGHRDTFIFKLYIRWITMMYYFYKQIYVTYVCMCVHICICIYTYI